MPEESTRLVHASGECEIDLARRELRVLGSFVPVGGRAFQIIAVLADSAGKLVTKDELLDRIWPGAIVGENTLHVHAGAIRKALGPYRSLLKTESGRGYRLLGDWTARRHDAARLPVGLQRMRVDGEYPLTNFPVPVTRLIGRLAAVARLRDLMSAYRLVTLTGPGGIGKTSLALKAARGILGEYADGGWLVELASLSDPALVSTTVAGALRVPTGLTNVTPETIARSIGDKKLLLVLDNCEHLIEAVATLAETLLVHCPQATIIATSRETLRIAGEQIYRVPPLEVPAAGLDDADHILSHGAVELFIARTKALDSGFSPRTDQLPSIGAICRHLDGIPLAIEFAAAHAAVLGVPHVVAGLRDRFALLTSGRRGVMQRHRTLRATLDWSYDLLPETERLLLRYLAVFSAGFSIDAAAAVVTDTGLDRTIVTDCIATLVSKSLLAFDRSAPDSRWYLLETIRAYAMEKLTERGEYPATARRHAEYLRDLIVPVTINANVRLDASNGSRCGRELDNVRAALAWAFSPEGDTAIGVTLTAAYAPIWVHLSLVGECCERVEQLRAIQQTGIYLSAPLERRMCIAYSMSLTMTLGSLERNRAAVIRAQELAEGIDDIDLQVHLLWTQWAVETNAGDYVTALVTAQRLAEVSQRGSDATRLLGDRYLGTSLLYAGRLDEARERLQRVIDRYVAPKDGHHTELFIYDQHLLARSTSARVLCLLGYVDRASAEARRCFEEASASGAGLGSCRLLQDGVWPVALITGDLVTAARATAAMIDWATTIDAPLWKMVGNCWNGKLLIERGEFAQGVELVSQAVEACERTGWLRGYAEILAHLAEGLAGLGKLDAAHDAIERAIDRAAHSGEVWHQPELMRIKGEILLQWSARTRTAEAEDCFRKASELARAQGALFWELRIALSLARVYMAQGRADQAKQLLASVYDRFTEGFAAPHLRAAKALLDEPRG